MPTNKGFTLIELLLVLAIIGIISAIAIPALLGQRARARDKTCISNVTGSIGDLVGAYDKARDEGANAAARIAAISSTLVRANARGDKNPWNPGNDAYATSIVASTTPNVKGEATFYVDDVTSPAALTGKVVIQFQHYSTGSALFVKRVGLD